MLRVDQLLRTTSVLRTTDDRASVGVPGDGMELGDLEITVHREPIPIVVLRSRAPVDPAVVGFDQHATERQRHVPRIRVRRATGGRPGMGQRRRLGPGRPTGIDAERRPEKSRAPIEFGKRRNPTCAPSLNAV